MDELSDTESGPPILTLAVSEDLTFYELFQYTRLMLVHRPGAAMRNFLATWRHFFDSTLYIQTSLFISKECTKSADCTSYSILITAYKKRCLVNKCKLMGHTKRFTLHMCRLLATGKLMCVSDGSGGRFRILRSFSIASIQLGTVDVFPHNLNSETI